MKKNIALAQLLTATMLWGFGLIATVWALRVFTPVETLVYRFFLASLIGLSIEFLLQRRWRLFSRKEILISLPAGIIMGLMQLTQTIGLRTTTATKGGFITSLYVILVPLISTVFLRNQSPPRVYIMAFIALIGTYLLMGASPDTLIMGDLWVFICAIFAAVHIIYIGRKAGQIQNAFGFNTLQSLWSFIILAPMLSFQKSFTLQTSDTLAIAGLMFLIFGSSLTAFVLQIKAQKYISTTMTTILTLLESPFAAILGYFLLSESLDARQAFGGALILGTSMAYVILDSPKMSKSSRSEGLDSNVSPT